MNQPMIIKANPKGHNMFIPENDNIKNIAFTWKNIEFTLEETLDPSTISKNKMESVQEKINSNIYYSRYCDDQHSTYDLEFTHKIAKAIINSKKEQKSLESALHDYNIFHINDEESDLWSDANEEAKCFTIALNQARKDHEKEYKLVDWDKEEMKEDLQQKAVDHAYENDNSKITDLLRSDDTCEISFILSPSNSVEDNCITSTKTWADWEFLAINDGLVGALGRMGYSLKEYREHSGNKLKKQTTKRHKVWPHKIARLDQLKELVDNACNSHFVFMIYAQVELHDLIKLKIDEPVMLNKYALATYNSWNGTFFDTCFNAPIIIHPEQAFFHLPGDGYSPDAICGLSSSYYITQIKN